MFRFTTYSKDELAACGACFVEEIEKCRDLETKDCTKFVLGWFRDSAGEGIRVFPDARFGEMLVDLCHISYPQRGTKQSGLDFWDQALKSPIQMKLAVESEWGRCGSTSECLVRMLDDAQKLAFLRADAKVMLFASCGNGDLPKFVERLGQIRSQTRDNAPWLWIDVPWRDEDPVQQGIIV